MLSQFTLTLELPDNELLLLTCIAEFLHVRSMSFSAGPAAALYRLQDLPPFDQIVERLRTYYPGTLPGWDIASVDGPSVTLRTDVSGSDLAALIKILCEFVPACLNQTIIYQPITGRTASGVH